MPANAVQRNARAIVAVDEAGVADAVPVPAVQATAHVRPEAVVVVAAVALRHLTRRPPLRHTAALVGVVVLARGAGHPEAEAAVHEVGVAGLAPTPTSGGSA